MNQAMQRCSLFPARLPRGFSRGLEEQPIEINGMRVEFDEKIALFPVEVEVEKINDQYSTRPVHKPGNGKTPARRRG